RRWAIERYISRIAQPRLRSVDRKASVDIHLAHVKRAAAARRVGKRAAENCKRAVCCVTEDIVVANAKDAREECEFAVESRAVGERELAVAGFYNPAMLGST